MNRETIHKKIAYLFLIVLVVAISFSPRLSLGLISGRRNIDIRAEDMVLGVGLLVLLCSAFILRKRQFKTPPLFWPVAAWLALGFFSILVNLILFNTTPEISFFYFLKEVEFFLLYFLVFYLTSKFDLVKPLLTWWFICAMGNLLWLAYVFIYNVKWSIYYGPETFMEPQGPFPSGGFFLMLCIFFFNLFIFYYSKLPIAPFKKILLFMLCLLPAAGVISSGSRTAVIGLFAALVISSGLYFFDRVSLVRLIKAVALLILLVIILLGVINVTDQASRVLFNKRFVWEYTSNSSDARLGILKNNVSLIANNLPNMIIGYGVKGEQHSQYMRVILERGFAGLLLFAFLIFSLFKISYRGFGDKENPFKRALSAGLWVSTFTMLIMAVPNDVFMVVKVDEVYWFFAALTMAVIINSQKSPKTHV